MPSIVLGSFGNVLSCLRGASGNFWGEGGGLFTAGLLGHVDLNTCPFLLVASRYCGRKGVS